MPCKDTEILELKQYQKPDKTPFIIYSDLESLIEKTDGVKLILKKLSTAKVGEHISSGFSMCAISQYKDIENKHNIS